MSDSVFQTITLILLVILAIFIGVVLGGIDRQQLVDQSAVCAVLEKHVPNRDPQIVNGECTMLVGVYDIRVRMNVVEYGELILEDEEAR